MNVTGEVLKIHDKNQITDKFAKKSVWIETQDKYPQILEIDFVNDNIDALSSFKKGDMVDISINLQGRGWTNKDGEKKVFNSIIGWKIEKVGANDTGGKATQVSDNEDDLPF